MKKFDEFIVSSKEEQEESIKIMAENLEIQNEPKVGIFWYDPREDELFGVVPEILDKSKKTIRPNTISILHKDYWKKEHHKRKAKNKPLGQFAGDFKDTPRGRIFWDEKNDIFQIKLGSWIKDYPEAKKMIIDEFDLQNSNYEFRIESHWEVGVGWEGY